MSANPTNKDGRDPLVVLVAVSDTRLRDQCITGVCGCRKLKIPGKDTLVRAHDLTEALDRVRRDAPKIVITTHSKDKGHRTFMAMANELLEKAPDACLLVMTDDVQHPDLKTLRSAHPRALSVIEDPMCSGGTIPPMIAAIKRLVARA